MGALVHPVSFAHPEVSSTLMLLAIFCHYHHGMVFYGCNKPNMFIHYIMVDHLDCLKFGDADKILINF